VARGGLRRALVVVVVLATAIVGLPTLIAPVGAQSSGYFDLTSNDAGILAYYRLTDATVTDSVGPHNGILGGDAVGGQPGALNTDTDTATLFEGDGYGWISQNDTDFRLSGGLSVEAWFNQSPQDSAGTRTIFRIDPYGYGLELIDGQPAGVVWRLVGNDETEFRTKSSTRFDDGQWHHIVMTFDVDRLRIFVDGGLVASKAVGGPVIYKGYYENVVIAQTNAFPATRYVGTLDEVAIYDRALSRGDIKAHIEASGRELRPIGDIVESERRGPCNPDASGIDTAQRSVADPVNTATGNFWLADTDLAMGGRGPRLGFTRTYNALSEPGDGPLGYGWTHGFDLRLAIDAAGVVTVHTETGCEAVFTPSAGGGYTTLPRVSSRLAEDGSGGYVLTRANQHTYAFDSGGRLVSHTDPAGEALTFSYDAAGRLDQVSASGGRSLSFTYDPADRITAVADGSTPARAVSFAYDAAGDLVSVSDPAGGVTNYAYDANHRILALTRPAQSGEPEPASVTNTYDAAGRVVAQSDELGRTTTFDYDSIPGATKVTSPGGGVTVHEYRFGVLVSTAVAWGSPEQATWSYAYEPASLGVSAVIDPRGGVATMDYDASGNLVSRTDAAGRSWTYTYDEANRPLSATDPAGVATTMAYDAIGNLVSVSTPLVGGAQVRTTTYAYDDPAHAGDLTSITDPRGQVWDFTYDAAGNLASLTDPAGDTTTNSYDPAANLVSTTSPRGNATGADPGEFTTTFTYDAAGALLSSTDGSANTTTRAYDADHNLVSTVDAEGRTTTFGYDAADQLIAVERPDQSTIAYAYDPAGNLTSRTDGSGAVSTYSYDAANRVVTATDAAGRETSLSYDPAGNVAMVSAADATTTSYSYDGVGAATAIDYSDATPDVSFTYDDLGRPGP